METTDCRVFFVLIAMNIVKSVKKKNEPMVFAINALSQHIKTIFVAIITSNHSIVKTNAENNLSLMAFAPTVASPEKEKAHTCVTLATKNTAMMFGNGRLKCEKNGVVCGAESL